MGLLQTMACFQQFLSRQVQSWKSSLGEKIGSQTKNPHRLKNRKFQELCRQNSMQWVAGSRSQMAWSTNTMASNNQNMTKGNDRLT
jgi:hypothetical protein